MPMKFNFEKHTRYFVETGCFYGFGIDIAIRSGFEFIKSIELADKYVEICRQKFANNPNVEIVKGDSGLILKDVISPINEGITFWLDGHCSMGDTAKGVSTYPIIEELTQIASHPIKSHVIYIDDIRLWKAYDDKLNMDAVITLLQKINPNYAFYLTDGYHEDQVFVEDILIAKDLSTL